MKTNTEILQELNNIGTLKKIESWIGDALASILFENEAILHAFNANILYYTDIKWGKAINDCFAVCTNERVVFIKPTVFSGIQSEIVLIKNIHSFEAKSSQIILKLVEQSIKVTISNYELTKTFGLILGYITTGRQITLTEIKAENEKYKANLEQIKLQQKAEFDRQIKRILTIVNKVVRHKSFKWWFPVFVIAVILFTAINKNETQDKTNTRYESSISTNQSSNITTTKEARPKLLKKGLFVCTSEENLKEFMNYATNNDMEGIKALIKGKHCLEIPCDCLQYSILDLSFGGVAKVRIWMPGKESDSDIVWTMKNALNEFDN